MQVEHIRNNITNAYDDYPLDYQDQSINKGEIETVDEIDHKDAEAVFISCTALRAVEVLELIEKRISKYVISSNQAIIWDCLRSVNINYSISG